MSASELDWETVFEAITDEESGPAWKAAQSALEEYIQSNAIEPPGMFSHYVDGMYLQPLVRLFLNRSGKIRFRRASADRVIADLIEHLDAPEIHVLHLFALEGFSAEHSFQLQPGIRIRPITDDEIMTYGRDDDRYGLYGTRPSTLRPRSDWWICETITPNPRGTALGWNSGLAVQERLAIALRAFQSGNLRIGLVRAEAKEPFGAGTGRQWGGSMDAISSGDAPYHLSRNEIRRFRKFWQQLSKLLDQDAHYLIVPIRRFRTGATRRVLEDALVDYVVGLEALLGKAGEGSELSYRFRVRGSVLMASKPADRRQEMKKLNTLYSLRSAIVHGRQVNVSELNDALPYAEAALRRVWRWYFDRYRDKPKNDAGVDRIDELLVGPR